MPADFAADTLALLCCPQTRQPLTPADRDTLDHLNARIAAGGARNQSEALITESLTAALIREDRQLLYPVRDAIPVLLAGEGIAL